MTTQTPTVESTNQLGESCFDEQGVQSCTGGDHAEWKIVPGALYRRYCLHCADAHALAVFSRAVGGARRARGRAPANRAPDRRASAQTALKCLRLALVAGGGPLGALYDFVVAAYSLPPPPPPPPPQTNRL